MEPIKVFIIDDALLLREVLKKRIDEHVNIKVIGTGRNTGNLLQTIHAKKPDVLIMNFVSTLLDDHALLDDIFTHHPLPIVIVGAPKFFDFRSKAPIVCVNKPCSFSEYELSRFVAELTKQVEIIFSQKKRTLSKQEFFETHQLKKHNDSHHVIALGASTGGTNATLQVLKELPEDFPCILVVQHMPPGFTKQYAERLNRNCAMYVKEAEEGDRIEDGHVFIAAGQHHLKIARDSKGLFIHSEPGDKVSGHCPSVDALFHSVAEVAPKNSTGVILTGMGRDGAEGLLSMKKKGAFTIGQDQNSCVVYGMPKVAFDIGAVTKQLPLSDIPKALIAHIQNLTK